jgi:tRNA pseudouridine38-40 synthase
MTILIMPRYKLTVAYDGTEFHGWQKQHSSAGAGESSRVLAAAVEDDGFSAAAADDKPGAPGDDRRPAAEPLRTAQGVLEDAVRLVMREPINLLGASRTDAGVHALGQIAAFSSTRDIPIDRLHLAINSRLPDDMQVIKAEIVPESFNPISDCIAKGYRYRIVHPGPDRKLRSVFARNTSYWCDDPLDAARMNDAARRIIGEHDFTSFTRVNHGRESTVRTVFNCMVTARNASQCSMHISGNGFLYNMVRIIAGTLVKVGRGDMEPQEIERILAARDRTAAGPTLPPEGLCLMWVRYA